IYNVGSDNEWPNLQIVQQLLRILRQPESMIEHVKDRPGHDRRYAIEARKARSELGWAPRIPFVDGLQRTVEWYVANRTWWDRVRRAARGDPLRGDDRRGRLRGRPCAGLDRERARDRGGRPRLPPGGGAPRRPLHRLRVRRRARALLGRRSAEPARRLRAHQA